MRKISIQQPPRVVFGEGSLQQFVSDFCKTGLKRLFIVSIPPVRHLLADMEKQLLEANVSVVFNENISSEPSFETFEAILKDAKIFGADSVVGIGGGSVLDVAKLLAAQLYNKQKTSDIIGLGLLRERKTYLACVPTTAGTGSEVSPNAIFLDEEQGGKKGVISPFLVPDAAYVDPALTLGVPSAVSASTGIDALTHCIEAFVNKQSHPMIDLYALQGIRLISQNLKSVCLDGNNIEARTNVLLGSLYGGLCLGPVNTAAVHALAYPLGSEYEVAHGLSNALLLTQVMEFNLPKAHEKYAELALAMGAKRGTTTTETAMNGIFILKKLIRECGLPKGLSEINIPESAIAVMAKSAFQVQRLLENNVRTLTIEDIKQIYRSAF